MLAELLESLMSSNDESLQMLTRKRTSKNTELEKEK